MAKNASLVLDLGCNKIKFGFAGESHPRVSTRAYYGQVASVLATDVGINDSESNSEINKPTPAPLPLQMYKFGEELKSSNPNYEYKRLYDVKAPSDNGYLPQQPHIDADLLCNLYSLELCPSLNVSPNYLPLLIGEPNNDTQVFRQSVLQLVENVNVPKIFIMKKGLMHAYSKGLTSALVFESGAVSSSVIVIEDGYVHQETYNAIPFGGDTITEMISEILEAKTCVPSVVRLEEDCNYCDSFYEYFKFLQAEDIKHKLLNLNPDRKSNGQMEEEYALPDGVTITMNEDDQKFCTQLFSKTRNSIVSKKFVIYLKS